MEMRQSQPIMLPALVVVAVVGDLVEEAHLVAAEADLEAVRKEGKNEQFNFN